MPAKQIADRLIANPVAHYPATTIAAFDPTQGDLPRRKLDYHKLVELLERYAREQVPAVLIAASTGQGHLRTVAELEEWFQIAALANLGSMLLTALLRPEDGLPANERLLDLLCRFGKYPVVFFRPGTNLPPQASDQQIAESLRPYVQAAADRGLAVGLYSIPDVSGVKLTPEAAARLIDTPGGKRIVAVKVTEANYEESTAKFLADNRLTHLKIVQGWDTHLARALKDGAIPGGNRCGITSGPMSFALYQYQYIQERADLGDWSEVSAAQEAVSILFRAMQDDPQKFADLQRAKYIMGLGEPLTSENSPAAIERVLQALESLPHREDRSRLARSLDLLGYSPFADRLAKHL